MVVGKWKVIPSSNLQRNHEVQNIPTYFPFILIRFPLERLQKQNQVYIGENDVYFTFKRDSLCARREITGQALNKTRADRNLV